MMDEIKDEVNISLQQQLEWKRESYEKLVLAVSEAGCETQYLPEGISVVNRRAEEAEGKLLLIVELVRHISREK